MKKYILIGIVALMMITPIAMASSISSINEIKVNTPKPTTSDFTHTVLGEYVTTTSCPYCPTASGQLYSIYNSGDYDFYFVSFVVDANYKIYDRVEELGVSSVPIVFFDGKYKNILGAQPNEQPYRNAIVQSGERATPNIDLNVDADWIANAVIKITVTVQNNEPENYNGVLRVYIVEPVSRWDDQSGNPYHYAVLDIPVDKPLVMSYGQPKPLGDTYTFKKTWFGALNGFVDITKDNIMVIASLFNKNTDHAVQTDAVVPASSSSSQYINIPQRYPAMILLELLDRVIDRFPKLYGLLNIN